MKRNLLITVILILPLLVKAQTNLLPVYTNPLGQYERGNWGPNLTHYGNYILLADFYFNNNNEPADFKGSYDLGLGYSYRYKLANAVNAGAALTFRAHWINLSNQGMSRIYDNEVHKKERLTTTELRLNPFLRFNLLKRRGNYLGSYIDVGAFGAVNLSRNLKVTDKTDDTTAVFTVHSYDEINKYYYGLSLAVGTHYSGIKLGVSANWNLRPVCNQAIETPKLSLGCMLIF